ncbi:MAG: hypothetical protein ACI39W_00560 [Brotaphodocola sp.]
MQKKRCSFIMSGEWTEKKQKKTANSRIDEPCLRFIDSAVHMKM